MSGACGGETKDLDDLGESVDSRDATIADAGNSSSSASRCDGDCGRGTQTTLVDASAPTMEASAAGDDAIATADARAVSEDASLGDASPIDPAPGADAEAGSAAPRDCCMPASEPVVTNPLCADELVGAIVGACDPYYPFPCNPYGITGQCSASFPSAPLSSDDVLVWRFAVLPPSSGLLEAAISTPEASAFQVDFEAGKVGSGTWGPGTVEQILPYTPGLWNFVEVTYYFATQEWTLNVDGRVSSPMPFEALARQATSIETVGFFLANGAANARIDSMAITKITPLGIETVFADTFDDASSMCQIQRVLVDPALCVESAPTLPPPANPLPISPVGLASMHSGAVMLEGDCAVSLFQTLPDNGTVMRCAIEFALLSIPYAQRDRIVSAELVLTDTTGTGSSAAIEVIVATYPADLVVNVADYPAPSDEVGRFVTHLDVAGEVWHIDVTRALRDALAAGNDLGFQVRLADETPSLNHGVWLGQSNPSSRPRLVVRFSDEP
jgi:hypothetical protein